MLGQPRAAFASLGVLLQLALPLWGGPHPNEIRFAQIDAFVERERVASRIPGIAVAIVEGSQVVHARGYGHDGNGNSITPATPFCLGSNTKSFTALAIMQMVEKGKLELDAPVVRYLPDFRLSDPVTSSTITVRQLLNQTSGLSHQAGLDPLMQERDETLDEAVHAMQSVKLNRVPGESFEYSNLNSVILGRIIEHVSGMSWQDYVQSQIFAPLAMANSYTSFEQANRHGMSAVHRFVFGFPFKAEAVYLRGMAPSGYLVSSAQDMARYLSYYLQPDSIGDRKPLSAEGIAAMLSPETNTVAGPTFTYRYGRGWAVGPFGAAPDARWHSGGLHSFNAWMVLLPETQQGVVVLINAGSYFKLGQTNGVFKRIPIGVVNILRGAEPPAGVGMAWFFAVFDIGFLSVLFAQIRYIRRITRQKPPSWWPSIIELALGAAALIAWPSLSGMGWRASFRSLPDLTLVIALVSILLIVQAGARLRFRTTQW